ncbi:hypothetical protein L9F63_014819 [Diploptera punctata]|uniref:Uncharacterized protein n=1 Tax=Diploptera punctata TaxID=6984 RepID=A0AAD8A7U2_DIPPU|nr:hypothetical protein L9F63_014819 [Diploptera punctata]
MRTTSIALEFAKKCVFCSQIVLALVALAESAKLSNSGTSTTTSSTTTTTTPAPKTEKEKRTLSAESALYNLDFYAPNTAHTKYVHQEFLQLPTTQTQQYVQLPASKVQQTQQQYIHVPDQKVQQYLQEQDPKVQQYLSVQEPKVQQYVQDQGTKVQQYISVQEPKLQQYMHDRRTKVQQYLSVQEPKVQQYVQDQGTKVQQYLSVQEPKVQQYVQEQGPKVQQYVQGKEYVQLPTSKGQILHYQAPEANKQPSFTVQYVPAQLISHSVDVLPKYQQTGTGKQSPKYQFVSKTQQQSAKAAPVPTQNVVVPHVPQQYVLPTVFGYHGNNYFTPHQYSLFNTPAYQYVLPSHHQAPAQYSLQPVVMMFTLPGGHYLNSHAGQNALLAFLTGAGSLGKGVSSAGHSSGTSTLHAAGTTVPTLPYLYHGQQLSYVVPPAAKTPVSHLVQQSPARPTYSQHNVQQPSSASSSVQYRTGSPAQYQIKS